MIKRIAITMPVFNNLRFTQSCIGSLGPLISHKNLRNSEFVMVVVDDGSTDGTGAWLREHHPEVVVLEGDGNLWWSGGVNTGAEHAIRELKADFMLLWNNDVIPSDDYFIQVDRLVGEMPDNVVAGSKIFKSGEKDLLWSCGGIFNPRSGAFYMTGTDLPDSEQFGKPMQVDWLPGMGTLIPSGVIEKIGFWDAKNFPQYHGDSDFTLRAREAGYQITVYPQLVLANDKSSSGLTHGGTLKGLYRALTSIRSNTRIRTSFMFYRKHVSSPFAYRTLIWSYMKMFGGFIKWRIYSLFGKRKNEENA